MKKSEIIGYVIISNGKTNAGIYSAGPRGSKEEQEALWFGNWATLFPTRAIAKRFIARSKAYATKQGYNWTWMYETEICPVRKLA